jgi:hypothetical protein
MSDDILGGDDIESFLNRFAPCIGGTEGGGLSGLGELEEDDNDNRIVADEAVEEPDIETIDEEPTPEAIDNTVEIIEDEESPIEIIVEDECTSCPISPR